MQIAAIGIDPGARAETLSPAQFGALAQAAARRTGGRPGDPLSFDAESP